MSQGQFSDIPYFLIKDFFDEVKNSKYKDKPVIQYDWEVKFVSTIINDDSIEFDDRPFNFYDSDGDSNIIFTNWETNFFNLSYYYNPNTITTSNSYIVSPFININTHGNGIVDLYVKDYDEGYLPISVTHLSTQGDRFNFSSVSDNTLIPGDTIESVLEGDSYLFYRYNVTFDGINANFENDSETYWRKDSLFHAWLKKYAHQYYLDKWGIDLNIRNYVNYDKIFSLFHKIFRSHDDKECRIIFYGMKNFVMDAIPEHQRTPKFKTFMDIYFDELYQENYNLLKNIWSLNDAMEVDRKYIGYLSKFYDMFDVDDIDMPELQLREFVRDMIWILKRKGTYTDFFILWKVLTNTKNRLNIYERWHVRNPAQWPEWPQDIDPNNTDTWPEWPYHYKHNKNFYSQSTPSKEWIIDRDYFFVHNNAIVQTFDSNFNEIIPYDIIINSNSIQILFDVETSGFAIKKIDDTMVSRHPNQNKWYVEHNLNNKNLVVTFDEDNSKVYESSLELTNENMITSTFDCNEDIDNRNANIIIGNYVYIQNTPESLWKISHDMITKSIMVNVYSLDNDRLIYSNYRIVDHSNIEIEFDIPISGYVVLIRTDKPFLGSTNVPTSAWHDTIYTMKPEYEQPQISGGAGPLWYRNNYPMTIDACVSDMSASVTYVREGAFVYTKHEVNTNIWKIEHNLGQKYVLVQTFDDQFSEIYPSEIFFDDENNVIITFPYDVRGFAFIKKNDLYMDRNLFIQSEWDIYTGFNNQDVIINFGNDSKNIIEKDTWLKDENNLVAYETTYSNVYTFTNPSITWNIEHNLDNNVIVQIYDHNFYRIIPSDITTNSLNEITIEFEEPVTGFVILKSADQTETQNPSDLVWNISNSIGNKNLIVDFNENDNKVYEDSLELIDDTQLRATFDDYSTNRDAYMAASNFVYFQNAPAIQWNVSHSLSSKSIVCSVYAMDNNKIIPSDYQIVSNEEIILYFDTPVNGYVILTQSDDLVNSRNKLENAFMLSADFKFEQHTPSTEWQISQYTEEIKGYIANVYSWDDIKMNPSEYNILTDGDYVTINFKYPATGYVLLEEICDYIDIRKDKKMMLSTHYIVEIDINDEPMDYHSVLSKSTWDKISVYWDYLRPVNRVVDYRIVLAPITNFSGMFISLYEYIYKNSDAYVQTKNEYYGGLEQGAYVHIQSEVSTEWYINHNLGDNIHIQVFDDDFNELIPYEIIFDSPSVVRLLFRSPITGFAMMKQCKEYQIQDPISNTWSISNDINQKELVINFAENNHKIYEKSLQLVDMTTSEAEFVGEITRDVTISESDYTHIQSTSMLVWDISHMLNTTSLSVDIYDENNEKVIPKSILFIDNNNVQVLFEENQAGKASFIQTSTYSFPVSANEWNLNHNLNSYTNVSVFDDNGEEIVPFEIIKDLNNIQVLFEEPVSGYININVADEYNIQDNSYLEWIINTSSINSEDIVIDFYENDMMVYESSTDIETSIRVSSEFSTNVGFSDLVIRDEVSSDGNYIYFQNTPSKIWNVNHNLGIRGWLCNVYDMNDERIHPSEYRLVDASKLTLEFNREIDGYIVLLKVGNLSLDGFNFENSVIKVYSEIGDMVNGIDPIYTGDVDRVIESNTSYYLYNTIPKEYEFIFNEIGVFNKDGILLFYTKCSDVYKPYNVLLTLHYRIEKTI